MSNYITHVHHVAIVVRNLPESVAWYCDQLDFEHAYNFTLPDAQVTMIKRGEARLELYQVEGASPAAPERQDVQTLLKAGGINHLALAVDDLEAVVARLASKGVEVVIPPTAVPNDSGDRFAFIRDNERMLVELFQPAPETSRGWSPPSVGR